MTALLGCTLSALSPFAGHSRISDAGLRDPWNCCADGRFNRHARRRIPASRFRRYGMRRRDAQDHRSQHRGRHSGGRQDLSGSHGGHKSEGFSGNELFRRDLFLRIRICRRESVQMFVGGGETNLYCPLGLRRKMSPFIFLASITGRTCGLTGRKLPTRRTRRRNLPDFLNLI